MMTKTLVWTQFAMKEGLAPKPPEFYVNEGDRLELYVATKAKTEPPAWDGEGLPPVGCVCRMDIGDGDTMDVEVVAHYKGSVVACSTNDAPSWNGYGERIFTTMESVGPKCLSPIRSEEDCAVEKMERIIGNAVDVAYEDCHEAGRDIYNAIRDGKVPGVKLTGGGGMSERKPGYYMVRYNRDGSPWEPAEWDGERWMLIGNGGSFSPSAIGEVGPRIPTPDEPWVTVPVQPDDAMIDAAFWAWGSTDVRSVYIDMISSAPKPEDT